MPEGASASTVSQAASVVNPAAEITPGDVNAQEDFDAAHALEYNEARGNQTTTGGEKQWR